VTLKLGLIGYGAIGKHVEAALKSGGIENLELVAALVRRPRNDQHPGGLLTHAPDRFFAHQFDAVAECAGHEAVRAHGQRVLEGGADLLVTSVGAFTDTALFERLLATAGETVWLDDEVLMDAVTAVSGSGPAYVFLLAEAMIAAARSEGLSADAARTLVLQTILGAARMLTEGDAEPAELRRRVTSPDGTTQAAIESFEAGGLRELVATAIHAARERSRELSAAND